MSLCVSTLPACAISNRNRSYSRGVSFTSLLAHGDDAAHEVCRQVAGFEHRPFAFLLQAVAHRRARMRAINSSMPNGLVT